MGLRGLARERLDNAKKLLSENSNQTLIYAALELRMAMEIVTYDRALAYKDEFPPSEYGTWQPRKVISVLLEMDQNVNQNSSIRFGKEGKNGEAPSEMVALGQDKVLNISVIKKHYDALGSYLHIQSMQKIQSGIQADYEKLRVRCSDLVVIIGDVLASPVFNITLGSFTNIDCMECDKPIRKRIPYDKNEFDAECFDCKASYTIKLGEGGESLWEPHTQEIKCLNEDCEKRMVFWRHELKIGRFWKCSSCGGENKFVLALQYKSIGSESDQSPQNS